MGKPCLLHWWLCLVVTDGGQPFHLFWSLANPSFFLNGVWPTGTPWSCCELLLK